MSRSNGMVEATVVTRRQWIGLRLAKVATGFTFLAAVVASFQLQARVSSSGASTVGKTELFVNSWSYVHQLYPPPTLIGWAYPPIALWVAIVVFFVSAGTVSLDSRVAVQRSRGRRIGVVRRSERRSLHDARQNLTRRLHERGGAGLFDSRRGMSVRLAVGLAAAGTIAATALLAPTSITISGQTIHAAQRGLLPWICLVTSLVALVGLLLAFPYGRRERVAVDASGNVRGADEPVMPPSAPPQPRSPAPA